jgi:hypothetical protein
VADPRPPTASAREPRDTLEYARDVARDLRSLAESTTHRLNAGAESFTLLRKAVADAEATAKAANAVALEAAAVKPIPWTRVIPICLVLLSGFAGVVATMARTPSRDLVEGHAAALEAGLRSLEAEIVAAQKSLIETNAAVKLLGEVASRRLDVLEQAARATRKGGK